MKAAGDGTVEFVGAQNGYGNIVVLKHRNGYSTAYGHLNGFARGLRVNSSVSQGQVIGYVGQTGWATGPHLHYELRVAGTPRDPLTAALPAAQPVGRAPGDGPFPCGHRAAAGAIRPDARQHALLDPVAQTNSPGTSRASDNCFDGRQARACR